MRVKWQVVAKRILLRCIGCNRFPFFNTGVASPHFAAASRKFDHIVAVVRKVSGEPQMKLSEPISLTPLSAAVAFC